MTFQQSLRQQIEIDGHAVHLTPMIHALAEFMLMRGPLRWIEMDDLIAACYPNPDDEPEGAAQCIKKRICRLRRIGVPILTRHGRGYRVARDEKDTGYVRVVRLGPPKPRHLWSWRSKLVVVPIIPESTLKVPPRPVKPRPRRQLNPQSWLLGQPWGRK